MKPPVEPTGRPPSGPSGASLDRHLLLAGVALALTVLIGAVLRGTLAGWGWPAWLGSWAHVRSAHSHLGYYGVLFPLAWHAWRRMGVGVPGPWTTAIYALAVIVSTLGFGSAGYAAASITGSTVVLGVWVISATPLIRFLPRRDWLAPVAPSVWLAAVAIPGVAVLASRGDPLAVPLVRGFLTWLLFGVVVATTLRRLEVPAPPGWLQVALVVGAGLALGPWPTLLTWSLLAGYGAMMLWAAARMEAHPVLRGLWAALGAGLIAVAAGLLPHQHLVAIAGLHFAALGPVLVALAWPERWSAALPAYAAAVAIFAAAILGPLVWPWAGWQQVAAGIGAAVAGTWLLRLGWAAWRWTSAAMRVAAA